MGPATTTVSADLVWSVNGEAIERARILRGWTRRDMAKEAHIDEGTLSDLLRGRRRPTFGTLRAISEAVGLGMIDLVVFAK